MVYHSVCPPILQDSGYLGRCITADATQPLLSESHSPPTSSRCSDDASADVVIRASTCNPDEDISNVRAGKVSEMRTKLEEMVVITSDERDTGKVYVRQ